MKKKLLALLVLISHINFSMFIPQLDELDVIDEKGYQVDDTNSLYDYIDEVVLRNKDITPDDEDDDALMYYHILKVGNYIFSEQVIVVNRPKLSVLNTSQSPVLLITKIPTVLLRNSVCAPEFLS